jgi:lipopolysaccharide transport system permease protein
MDIRKRLKKLYSFRQTLWSMSLRQLRLKYSGSVLGLWWAVITPCLLALSINLIFSRVFNMQEAGFTFFVLSGILVWFFFSSTLSELANCFTANAPLLRQCSFPREIIPLACVTANFLNFLVGFLFLLPLFIIAEAGVLKMLPFLLAVFLFHLMFVAGLGIMFSTANVFFRDLGHLLPVGLMIWFWITPIFYRLTMLDFPYRWICLLNPLSYYTIAYQRLLFEGKVPSAGIFGLCFLIGFGFICTGYHFFLKKEKSLLKRL